MATVHILPGVSADLALLWTECHQQSVGRSHWSVVVGHSWRCAYESGYIGFGVALPDALARWNIGSVGPTVVMSDWYSIEDSRAPHHADFGWFVVMT